MFLINIGLCRQEGEEEEEEKRQAEREKRQGEQKGKEEERPKERLGSLRFLSTLFFFIMHFTFALFA